MRTSRGLKTTRRVYNAAAIVLAGAPIVLAAAAAGSGGGSTASIVPGREEAGSGAGSAAAGATRPALAVYRPIPPTPLETAGSGLGPTLHAMLSVDGSGKVTRVSIAAIEPSGPLDEPFRRAAEQALRRWRFRPASRAGRPVASDVSVSIRFEPRTTGRARWSRTSIGVLHVDSERELRRLRVLALPGQRRRALLEGVAGQAESLLAAGSRRVSSSEHFSLMTDAPGAADFLETLEEAWDRSREILDPDLALQPLEGRVVAVVFATRAAYERLARTIDAFEWSSGLYHPAGLLAAHLEGGAGTALATLRHEASHAFFDLRVNRPGVALPRWIDEGLALYVELSASWDADGAPRRGAGVLGKPHRLGLADLIGSTPGGFHGEDRAQHYADSWRAVHFLRHGEETWARERFPKLLLLLAEGYGFAESFRAAWGREPDALEKAFRLHAVDL